MKKDPQPVSIRIKYTRYVIPILLVSFLTIGVIDTLFYFHSIRNSSENEKKAYTSSTITSLESYLGQFTSDSSIFFYKTAVQDVLLGVSRDGGQAARELLLNDAPYYPSLNASNAENAFFISPEGTIFHIVLSSESLSAFSEQDAEALTEKSSTYHGLPFLYDTPDEPDRLFLCRDIYLWTGKTATTGKYCLGTLVVEPKASVFDEIFSLNSDAYQFALTDQDGHIYRNQTDLADGNVAQLAAQGELRTGSSRYTASDTPTSFPNLRLLLISNESVIYQGSKTFVLLLLLPSALCLLAIIAATEYISGSIAREFDFFIQKLNETTSITSDAFIHMDSSTEFAELSNVYNHTLTRIHDLSERIHEQEILTKNIEIENLQSQINPHFLYNTLNCISGLVDMDRKEECHKALTALADIERMSIKGKPFCTLEEELIYIQEYAYIQKLRFEEKLSILIDIPRPLYRYYIPKLVIQPLMENAVIHGTSKTPEHGIIAVLGTLEGSFLQITVKDNGPGFREDFLQSFSSEGCQRPSTSYGLHNIDRRLKLYYGEEFGLRLMNTEKHGACVVVRIPLRESYSPTGKEP